VWLDLASYQGVIYEYRKKKIASGHLLASSCGGLCVLVEQLYLTGIQLVTLKLGPAELGIAMFFWPLASLQEIMYECYYMELCLVMSQHVSLLF
jgi:hypothetical protein